MAKRYKAFISYRHLPLDLEVAKWTHRRIERYPIPKALRRDGAKRLGRVFRDKDELPLSSNLSSSILEALDDSEYLIVVCTPETKESRWVMTEIDHFVSTHDRDHVLAILASGTAEASFPRQLCEERSSEGELVREVEPLAADIVATSGLRRRRLFRTESLRIIASLIGCAFDDLYRREQRFRLRRMAVAMSVIVAVAAGFIGMLMNRNAEIRGNYERALRNQSMYLAEESLEALEGDDRLTATALALEALPKEAGERPVVSRAEFALGRALDTYVSSRSASGFRSVGILGHHAPVKDYRLNGSRTVLCSLCQDGSLCGWDVEGMGRIWTSESRVEGLMGGMAGFAGDSALIAWSDDEVWNIDATSGETTWSVPTSGVFPEDDPLVESVLVPDEGGTVVALSGESICVLDIRGGSLLRSMPLPRLEADGREFDIMALNGRVSPDGSLLAVECSVPPADAGGVVVLDLEDGSTLAFEHIDGPCAISHDMAFTNDGTVVYDVCLRSEGDAGPDTASEAKGGDRHALHCLDMSSGELRWEYDHDARQLEYGGVLRLETDAALAPMLVFAYDNHLDLLDPSDGKPIAQAELDSHVVGVDVADGRVCCITGDGAIASIDLEDPGEWHSLGAFVDDLDLGELHGGRAWVQQTASTGIVCYDSPEAYPNWAEMDVRWRDGEDGFREDEWLISPGCIAFLEKDRLLFNNGDTTSPLRELRLATEADSGDREEFELGFFESGTLALTWEKRLSFDGYQRGVAYVDVETGACRYVPWEVEGRDLTLAFGLGDAIKWVGIVSERTAGEGGDTTRLSVCVLDEDLRPEKTIDVGTCTEAGGYRYLYDRRGRMLMHIPDSKRSFLVDLDAAEAEELGEDGDRVADATPGDREGSELAGAFSPDGSLMALMRDADECLVMDDRLRTRYSIRGESSPISAVTFTADGRYLLTVEHDGYMRRYRASDGEPQGRTELYCHTLIHDSTPCSFHSVADGVLAVLVDDCMNLVSTDDWGVLAYVERCRGYLEDQRRFVCYGGSVSQRGRTFGTCAFYSLDDLVACGNDALHGWALSEDQRIRYGLE